MIKKIPTILFTCNDTFILDLYRKIGQSMNVNMVTFEDAKGDIVQRVLDVNPELISMDIVMPGRDGYEAMQILKADPRTSHIPIFVLSNLTQKADREKSVAGGAVEHVVMSTIMPREIIDKYLAYLAHSSVLVRGK